MVHCSAFLSTLVDDDNDDDFCCIIDDEDDDDVDVVDDDVDGDDNLKWVNVVVANDSDDVDDVDDVVDVSLVHFSTIFEPISSFCHCWLVGRRN